MLGQRNEPYRAIPLARAHYDRLCRKYGTIPTSADIDAIKSAIGPVSTHTMIQNHFEAALLFFLPRSDVQFENGSSLIGWVYEDDGQTKREVWYKPPRPGKGSLCHVPGYLHSKMYSPPEGSTCEEWHPVIFDIINPNENKSRILQYAYFKACIQLLQDDVPSSSIEHSPPASIDFTPINSATLNPDECHQETSETPDALPTPGSHRTSVSIDLTGTDEAVVIKSEVTSVTAPVKHNRTSNTRVQEKIQAFRDKLNKKEVEELQQMLERQLPSWIKKLAEDVLQKKMLEELELAESFLV
jgi:hypothetical protein